MVFGGVLLVYDFRDIYTSFGCGTKAINYGLFSRSLTENRGHVVKNAYLLFGGIFHRTISAQAIEEDRKGNAPFR